MIILGEQETDVDLFQDLCTFFRRDGDLYAKCFQNICCTALGRCCTVSVFCYRNATCCDHKRRCRGNVKGVCSVTTGSYDFQNIHIVEELDAVCTHSGC